MTPPPTGKLIICAPRASGKTPLARRLGWIDADDILFTRGLPHGPEIDQAHLQSAQCLVAHLLRSPSDVAVTDLSPVLVARAAKPARVAVVTAMPSFPEHLRNAKTRGMGLDELRRHRRDFVSAAVTVARPVIGWHTLVTTLRGLTAASYRQILAFIGRAAIAALFL